MTFNWVAVAEATVPTAPLLNVTVLWAVIESNPVPVMTMEVALMLRFTVLEVTVGVTLAVCPVKARLFKRTLAFPELKFAVVISSLPSPFRSPKATESGPSPAAKVT